jgi:hypothetical protein
LTRSGPRAREHVRNLLVDYLRERRPAIDYGTVTSLAATLVLRFWKDLERRHLGIDSLRLSPETAAAWKQRIRTRIVRSRGADGEIIETTVERDTATDALTTVRSFYLDLAQWALDDPARWGPWAVPCPIRATDIQHKKMNSRRKARMDQRTRDRLPVLPVLVEAVERERKAAAALWRQPSEPTPARRSPSTASRCASPGLPDTRPAFGPRNRPPGAAAT